MDTAAPGLAVLIIALAGLAAVLSSRASERLRIPAPAFFLLAAAGASDLWPRLGQLPFSTVEQVVTVALAVILFDGGMGLGWRRFRGAALPILGLGTAGTLATAGGVAAAAHLLAGLDWRVALLLGAALAPTDPAVVFSVLGGRQLAGRGRTILEGESGSNDPVSIGLLAALLATSATGPGAAGQVAAEMVPQLAIGLAAGGAGGWALRALTRRVALPREGLYPVRVLAGALAIYGAAAAAGGSGFLAVFVAGLIIGDARVPGQREITRFHSALASLAEIVAFALLGLTVQLNGLFRDWAWLIGLALAVVLAVVIRPLVAGALLWRARLPGPERVFVLWPASRARCPSCSARSSSRPGCPVRGASTRSSLSSSRSRSSCRAARCRGCPGGCGYPQRDHGPFPPLAQGAFTPAQHGVTCHQHGAASLTTPRAAGGDQGLAPARKCRIHALG